MAKVNGVFKYLGIFSLILLTTSCSIQTKKLDVTPDIDNSFIDAGQVALAANWWQSFADEKLNELVAIGLTNNQSLVSSLAKVKSASAGLTVSQSAKYPDLNLVASSKNNYEKLDRADTASLGVTSSWELDLWGRIASLEQKAVWDVAARQALYKARANVVAGSIANAWFGWIAASDKQKLFADQYNRTNVALTVINRRFAMGKNSITDIWQQQRLLESIVAQQAVNDARLAISTKKLALWLGVKSSQLPQLTSTSLPTVPPLPNMGLPLSTLQYRPDIQQAFAVLQASNASMAAAVTDRFPRITLRASYSTHKNSVQDLFDDWSGSLISSLVLPLFDAGAKKAVVKQKEYALQASFADYKQTWFDAIYAVESSLITEQQLSKVANNIDLQMSLAKKTERVIVSKYLNGKASYLTLLKAQETSLKLERQVVDAQQELINNRVSLYRELSHGNFTVDRDVEQQTETDFAAKTIIDENT